MELVKQPINITFRNGLDLKTDPYQVQAGNFLSLTNSVFDSLSRLTKRNGFPYLTNLPSANQSFLTTLNNDLQALGNNLYSYAPEQTGWVNQGSTYPIRLSTMPLIRNNTNQSQCDSAVAPNGLICTVYTDQLTSSLSTPVYKYVIADSVTGQNVIPPTPIPVSSGVVTNAARVFILNSYFVIVFGNVISAVNHLQYITIPSTNPTAVSVNNDVSVSFDPSTTLAFDGVVANNSLYIAWNGGSASGIKVAYLAYNLVLSTAVNPDPAHTATMISVTADESQALVWVSYYSGSGTTAYTLAVAENTLVTFLGPTANTIPATALNITSAAQNGVNTVFYEIDNNYGYASSVPTNYIETNTISSAGTVGTAFDSVRSVGLASKAFIINKEIYYLAAYSSPYQPTYFLINGSTSTAANPIVIAKIAYQNGGPTNTADEAYLPFGLPSVTVNGTEFQIPYLFKDLIEAVNKNTNVPTGSQVAGVYSQLGINLATFNLDTMGLTSSEIAENLALTGGFLWSYDGYQPVEHNFFVYPDSIVVAGSGTTGSMSAQQYFYQVTYEWTDNQGNAYRSAPSIPVSVTLTSDTSVDVNVPTLRLTYKINNPVKIVIYRWSVAQQSYYQTSSIDMPIINDTTIDFITFNDTNSDATILGNNLIYVTGGVVEDINAPSSSIMTLFDDRLWLVDAEDTNLLWFSKQVIEATPVEMSDLFMFYVAPNTGTQGSTGPLTAIFPMDDKLVLFKKNAILYINGTGPDNAGNNNQYSQPIFVTASVGCANPRSIAVIPNGLMFQSDKGIWLLGRDLSTQYIGAPVEAFNQYTVNSAVSIPGTNQIRFGLSNGTMLLYDYFVGQWGVFDGIPSISATIYKSLHTIINQYGQISQEQPGTYLDGGNPVLMSFTTAWLNLGGLRGYQRGYFFFFLGTFLSPIKFQVDIAYDYNSSPSQSDLITPDNFNANYGDDPYYGLTGSESWQNSYGGIGDVIQQRVFLQRQRCRAFQISVSEVFNPALGVPPGAGFTLSGLNVMVGFKKSYAPIAANRSWG